MARLTRKGRRNSALQAHGQEQDQLARLVAEAAPVDVQQPGPEGAARWRQQPKLWSMPPSTSLSPPPPTRFFPTPPTSSSPKQPTLSSTMSSTLSWARRCRQSPPRQPMW